MEEFTRQGIVEQGERIKEILQNVDLQPKLLVYQRMIQVQNIDETDKPIAICDDLALDIATELETFFKGRECETLNVEYAEHLLTSKYCILWRFKIWGLWDD